MNSVSSVFTHRKTIQLSGNTEMAGYDYPIGQIAWEKHNERFLMEARIPKKENDEMATNVGAGTLWCSIAAINGQQTPYPSPMKAPLTVIATYWSPNAALKSFEILLDGKVVVEEKVPANNAYFTIKTHLTGTHTIEVKVVDQTGAVATDMATISIS